MIRSLRNAVLLAAVALSLGAPRARGESLDDPLKFLEPLLGRTWVGGYVEGPGAGLKFTDSWEISLGGKEVLYRRVVPKIPFTSETHVYWDREQGKVAFLRLNTKGDVGTGIVSKEGKLIVLRGKSLRPGESVVFKTTLEILPDGRLRDLFYTLEDGAWVQRHHQEFTALEPDRD